MKKFTKLMLAAASILMLGACEKSYSEKLSSNSNVVNIEEEAKGPIKSAKRELQSVVKSHDVKFNDSKFSIEALYGIDKEFAALWYYTIPNNIQLEVKTKDLPENYEVIVNNVYADVTISSRYERYNGARQDSMNLSYSNLPQGGFTIDNKHPYTQPFLVEGVNQSETFLSIWNGYGHSETRYLTERDVRAYSDGVIIRVVWTLGVKDKSTGQLFNTTIEDDIYVSSSSKAATTDVDTTTTKSKQ